MTLSGTKMRMHLFLDTAHAALLRDHAARLGVPMSSLVREILEDYSDKLGDDAAGNLVAWWIERKVKHED